MIALAALVYLPMNPRTNRSLIFFEDIASLEFEDFRSRAVNQGAEQIECKLLDQIHRVSRVASIKMGRVWRAILMSLAGVLLWFALLTWHYL